MNPPTAPHCQDRNFESRSWNFFSCVAVGLVGLLGGRVGWSGGVSHSRVGWSVSHFLLCFASLMWKNLEEPWDFFNSFTHSTNLYLVFIPYSLFAILSARSQKFRSSHRIGVDSTSVKHITSKTSSIRNVVSVKKISNKRFALKNNT